MNPYELLKRTPQTNCGKCGLPTCLAFAATLAKGGIASTRCPELDTEGLTDPPAAGSKPAEEGREHDLKLVSYLKSKITNLEFAALAEPLGLSYTKESDSLSFSYLGSKVVIDKSTITLDGAEPEDPRDQILLYNYLAAQNGRTPDSSWIGMESMPNSISKIRTLETYCERPLAENFSGRPHSVIILCAEKIGGMAAPSSSASCALLINVLPMVPHYLHFWEAEPEDGFEARVKILFDHHVLDFLDIESLVFSAERMAEKFLRCMNQT